MDRLFYYSKSIDKQAGKGVNENVKNPDDYTELNKQANWRKVLSNFYISPFTYDNKKWNTVEHAFQSKKIELVDKTIAYQFTMDSKSELGLGDGLAARMKRKVVLLDDTNLEKWDKIKSNVMKDILYAKFSQNELPKKILLLTNNAELWHAGGREKPTRQYELEKVRELLKE